MVIGVMFTRPILYACYLEHFQVGATSQRPEDRRRWDGRIVKVEGSQERTRITDHFCGLRPDLGATTVTMSENHVGETSIRTGEQACGDGEERVIWMQKPCRKTCQIQLNGVL